MAIDTAVFVAGVSLLVTLDLFGYGVIYTNTRNIGTDEQAREQAERAEKEAKAAHRRLDRHEQDDADDTAQARFSRRMEADGGIPVEQEPDGDALAPHHFYVGVALSLFGFVSVWPYYPVTGSTFALVGLLVALDDVVSHTFGWSTPLDLLWKRAVHPALSRWVE